MFLVPSKIFWGAHKHQVVVSKDPYKHQILPLKSLKPYKTTKNRRVLTFSQLKTVWSIARYRRCLLRVPKDLNKCLTTYFDVLGALENFLSAHERRAFISKFRFLSKFWQNFGSGEFLRLWDPKNHQMLTFSTLKTVWGVVRCYRLLLHVAMDLH